MWKKSKCASSSRWSQLLFAVTLLIVSDRNIWAEPAGHLTIKMPDTIYTTLSDPAELDRDLDGLKDDYENRLADTWRPYFVFDENENAREYCHDVVTGVETVLDTACVVAGCAAAAGFGCAFNAVREAIEDGCKVTHSIVSPVCKGNISDDSLQPFEPVTLFQVRPLDATASWPRRIQIKWGFLWRLDGGYRMSNWCTDYHYGDTQGGFFNLVSNDGITWALESISIWEGGIRAADSSEISWTNPRSTYWNEMEQRPSPIIYASAGKHHQYISADSCESEAGTFGCDDDCGGGAQRLVNLAPNGLFNNVGEYGAHPDDKGTNNPFVTALAPLGYPDEYVWWAKWRCNSSDCFTGGVGTNWSCSSAPQSCTVTSATYTLFDKSIPSAPPKEVGLLYTLIPTCY